MDKSRIEDPFEEARIDKGYAKISDQEDPVVMLLRHRDVRKCAHQWKVFQSGAQPGRIVVPSEVAIRDTRQIPFEVDPPDHGDYRAIIEEWFRRPLLPEYEASLRGIIDDVIDNALEATSVEVVGELALPLQSRALTLLLNTPYEESALWISWGTHVFRSESSKLDASKANILYDYIDNRIDEAIASPGDDLYSKLLDADFQGRKLTKEEVKGVLILTFAGGRDTVINYVTNAIAYLADQPQALVRIRENPALINTAVEEFVRYFSPLTHMGRVATENTEVCQHAIAKDSRVSLCWASANRDASVFENPNEVVLDRKVNPHVAFGFGTHKCLGATHARQIMKVLLMSLSEKVESMEIISKQENIEEWGEHNRKVGYDAIRVAFK